MAGARVDTGRDRMGVVRPERPSRPELVKLSSKPASLLFVRPVMTLDRPLETGAVRGRLIALGGHDLAARERTCGAQPAERCRLWQKKYDVIKHDI